MSGAPNPHSPQCSPNHAKKVGIMFVKQYYNMLSTRPELLQQFYAGTQSQDLTYVSHGEGPEAVSPVILENTFDLRKERWGGNDDEKMLFIFDGYSIDCQPSTNGGILLVVAGCVKFFKGNNVDNIRRKKFIQTFFLSKYGRNFSVINDVLRFLCDNTHQHQPKTASTASINSESKKVATATSSDDFDGRTTEKGPNNDQASLPSDDILNSSDAPTSVHAANEMKTDSSHAVKEIKTVESKKELPKPRHESFGRTDDAEYEAPGRGIEESKEEAPDDDDDDDEVAVTEEQDIEETTSSSTPNNSELNDGPKRIPSLLKDGKSKKNKIVPQSQNKPPTLQQQPTVSKPIPGSWASLVVSGSSAPNTPSRKTTQLDTKNRQCKSPLPNVDSKDKYSKENEPTTSKNKMKPGNNNHSSNIPSNMTNNAKSGSGGSGNNCKSITKLQLQQQRTKRDPDNTLVIKNLSDNIKEQDIINMFQPYASQTKAKIVGTNLNHNRHLAFVDYDCVAPVNAALKKHVDAPFEWNGKILEVDQKSMEQRLRRKSGTGNGNNSNVNNGYRNVGGSGNVGNGNANSNRSGGSDQYNRRSSGGGRRRSRGGR